jgi:hypothetical protein
VLFDALGAEGLLAITIAPAKSAITKSIKRFFFIIIRF